MNVTKGTISASYAIKMGRIFLLYLPLFIMVGMPFLFFACYQRFFPSLAGAVVVSAIVFLSIILPFLYTFLALPCWRIWAFSRVQNVHELKQRAILAKVLPEDNSVILKWEMKTVRQREALAAIDRKFDMPDVFVDDPNIGKETPFGHSRILIAILLLYVIACISATIYFLATDEIELASMYFVICGVIGYPAYEYGIKKRRPLLTIGSAGITTVDHGLHTWDDIRNERVEFVYIYKNSYYALRYEINDREIDIEIPGNADTATQVLRIYRARYEAANVDT